MSKPWFRCLVQTTEFEYLKERVHSENVALLILIYPQQSERDLENYCGHSCLGIGTAMHVLVGLKRGSLFLQHHDFALPLTSNCAVVPQVPDVDRYDMQICHVSFSKGRFIFSLPSDQKGY